MSRRKTPSPTTASTAAQAARIAEMLTAADPTQANERSASAARHLERRSRQRGPSAAKASSDGPPPGGPRNYLPAEPTRSPVMNAFLQELPSWQLVPESAGVLGEHLLAPALMELARRQLVSMLLSLGSTEAGLIVAARTRPITNEGAARLFLRQAARTEGGLGSIARDYEEHTRRLGPASTGDRLSSCMMAAFAGRLIAFAARSLGPHVREDVQAELLPWISEQGAPVRKKRVRELPAPAQTATAPGRRRLRRA